MPSDTMEGQKPILPDPIDLTHLLSRNALNRQPSSIKDFYRYFSIPGIGQLAGGLPNSHYFPYDDLEAKTSLPNRWRPTPNKPVDPPSAQLASTTLSGSLPSSRLVVPKEAPTRDLTKKIDLFSALQYGTAQGYPPLYSFLKQFTRENLHPNIPYNGGPDIILTCGNTDGFGKVLQAFNNEWNEGRDPIEEREGLLCEEYAYMNAIQAARPRGLNIAPVGIDDEGMRAAGPGGLEDVMSNWDYSKGRRPHLMYTVTIGQNPTSGTLSVKRRREIYEICAKYDVIIVEDDPYWYLQFPSANDVSHPAHVLPKGHKSSGFDFLDSLVPSYLSVDYQGRVIRLDTFSKTVAPGCRLGWITAQPALIERLLRITETSTQQPSGFVQSMIAELIMGPQAGSGDGGQGGAKDGSGWKVDGWVRWLEGLRGEYERRMVTMCDILDEGKHLLKVGRRPSLSSTLANTVSEYKSFGANNGFSAAAEDDEWTVVETKPIYDFVRPLGGMFIWLRFNFNVHPLASTVRLQRLARALWVFWTSKPYLILLSPGTIFAPTEEIKERDAWECFRVCFAACDADMVEDLSKRTAKGARDFFKIRDEKKIDEILEEDDKGKNVMDVDGLQALTHFC